MGRSLSDVYVQVAPDLSKFGPQLKRELNKQNVDAEAGKLGKRFGGVMHNAIGSALGGLGALTGAALGEGLSHLFGSFIEDARESAKISRVTEAVIKSTGGSAQVSAKQVGALATAISNKTGADDEAIQSGQNLLLTFTNVKNGVGASNKIFDQASVAATDMAAALNDGNVSTSTIKSSSILLGKALNDPVKGLQALTRVGVSFTNQQKDQIKALIKSGDTLGAQKVILKELGKEFGGAAQAAGDPMQKLNTIVGNLGEQIGGYLLPYIGKFADFLGTKAAPAVADFLDGIASGKDLKGFSGFLQDAVGAAKDLFAGLTGNKDTLTGFSANIAAGRDVIKSLVGWLSKNYDIVLALGGALAILKIGSFVKDASAAIKAVKTWTIFQGGLNVALTANPIGVITIAIAALVAGFIIAYKRSETFRKIVNGALGAVAAAGSHMWNDVLKPIFRILIYTWLQLAGGIVRGAAIAFGWVPGIGPKLKKAADKFDDFKRAVNRSLAGVQGKSVTIAANVVRSRAGSKFSDPKLAATGGRILGAGSGTSDSIPAMLSNGEHVWTAREVSAAGGHSAVESVRKAALSGTLTPTGFATGGGVGIDPRVQTPSAASLGAWSDSIARRVVEVEKKQIIDAVSGAYNKGLDGGLRFAKAQSGKPYIWGGVGPRGYDCSGFMSAIYNVVQGKNPYSRRFSTANFPTAGWSSGPGAFMIGRFRGSPGHMAGTINGVNVESSGDRGAHYGRGARGARDRIFSGLYHLRGYALGGAARVGDLPFDLLNPRGRSFDPALAAATDKLVGNRHMAFANGGRIGEPVVGLGLNTGRSYSFGEKGPETVIPNGGSLRLHPDDIRAIGREMGNVVLGGIGANNASVARHSNRLVRGG